MQNVQTHRLSEVETQEIGEGSRIWAFVHILPGAKIGKNANICDHCYIENNVVIGNDCTIKCGVYLWDGITIEDNVQVGPAAAFTNDKYPRAKNTKYTIEKTTLKKGCSIGANATIIGGVTIGMYALVGAGAVVTHDVGDFELVYGNPAELKGYVCVCAQKLTFTDEVATCTCGRSYEKRNEKVSLTKE
jgi:acetyltransferase-like isoleucine patch superfamily enzyme